MKSVRWNTQEDAKLRRLVAKGLTANQIALELDRTPRAIFNRRSLLGLGLAVGVLPDRNWSEEHTAILLDGIREYLPYSAIGRKVGRSAKAVSNYVCQLRRKNPHLIERDDSAQRSAPEPTQSDDPAHVAACLAGGGFGRLPIPWREPIQVWRAA